MTASDHLDRAASLISIYRSACGIVAVSALEAWRKAAEASSEPEAVMTRATIIARARGVPAAIRAAPGIGDQLVGILKCATEGAGEAGLEALVAAIDHMLGDLDRERYGAMIERLGDRHARFYALEDSWGRAAERSIDELSWYAGMLAPVTRSGAAACEAAFVSLEKSRVQVHAVLAKVHLNLALDPRIDARN